MTMTHPGMPLAWGVAVWSAMLLIALWGLWSGPRANSKARRWRIDRLPLLGQLMQFANTTPWVLLPLRLATVCLFLLVIVAGLAGSPLPGRNLATVLTWNLWWAGLVVSIFFLGSAWCSICPWDAIANWVVRRRLWRRADADTSLNLSVPLWLRNVWPALVLFVGLTWLELGVGITMDPYATAVLALVMVVLATFSLAVFKRKAFCRHFCPVGRTIGFYSQLAPVELRPVRADTCAQCQTLECYRGSESVDPCPTNLLMGTLKQNTYCTSCGNCVRACPERNVAWRLRSPSAEALEEARPHWDEAWFMLVLMALTTFHGITMMPFWESGVSRLAQAIGDSGQLLWSFSIGLTACIAVPVLLYALAVVATRMTSGAGGAINIRRRFVELAFVAIPLAFSYHISHNLNHLLREGNDVLAMMSDPLGWRDVAPLTLAEQANVLAALTGSRADLFDTSVCISARDGRVTEMMISQGSLFSLQAILLVAGFYIAIRIIRRRAGDLIQSGAGPSGWRLAPMIAFAAAVTSAHLYLLMQPMMMRLH